MATAPTAATGPELLERRLARYSEQQRMVLGANTYRNHAQMPATGVVQGTLFPVITGKTGLNPVFRDAADVDLRPLESRTLDGHTVELLCRPVLHA